LPLPAQQLYKLGPETKVQIEGTSTLHDWTSTVNYVRGEGKFNVEGNTITQITEMKVTMVVKSIRSGKGAMMDNNTYKALKAEQHPEILFELQSMQVLPNQKLTTTGKLTIAGVSKVVKMEVGYQVNAGKVTVNGELPILMKEYKIDPPTAMMGTIKTGEEVKVVFTAVFAAAKQLSAL
jgi:polyisoprenoid-binding protein YceI